MGKKEVSVVVALSVIVVIALIVSVFNEGITGNSISPTTFRANSDCSENDLEEDPLIFGELIIQTKYGTENWPDKCSKDRKRVIQYYCRSGKGYGVKSNFCEFGCKEGVCLERERTKKEVIFKKIVDSSVHKGKEACNDNEWPNDKYKKGTLTFQEGLTYEFSDYCKDEKNVIQLS